VDREHLAPETIRRLRREEYDRMVEAGIAVSDILPRKSRR
jgi:hypothetical protein